MIRILTLVVLMISQLHAVTLGRESVFLHIDSRSKRLDQGVSITLTGRESGLMLQCPKNAKVIFQQDKSKVVTPDGEKINFTFKECAGALRGYWFADFIRKHEMKNGLYEYIVVISIDDKEYLVQHKIEYSFEMIEGNKGSVSQK